MLECVCMYVCICVCFTCMTLCMRMVCVHYVYVCANVGNLTWTYSSRGLSISSTGYSNLIWYPSAPLTSSAYITSSYNSRQIFTGGISPHSRLNWSKVYIKPESVPDRVRHQWSDTMYLGLLHSASREVRRILLTCNSRSVSVHVFHSNRASTVETTRCWSGSLKTLLIDQKVSMIGHQALFTEETLTVA